MKLFIVVLLSVYLSISVNGCMEDQECKETLRPGQYYCASLSVDPVSQSVLGCDRYTGTVSVPCYAAPNVSCGDCTYKENQTIFTETRQCTFVDGRRYNYYLAVGLSLFLGMLGVDRFYLGYPAIGLMKLCTLGFFLIGHLLDFLLILLQVVGPADRTGYYAPFYGPLINRVNDTDPFLGSGTGSCV